MTPEQEEFWKKLKYDPAGTAHNLGSSMKRLKGKKFQKAVDENMRFVVEYYTVEDTIRIVKTWLSYYQLPFDPSKMESFDLVHHYISASLMQKLEARQPIESF